MLIHFLISLSASEEVRPQASFETKGTNMKRAASVLSSLLMIGCVLFIGSPASATPIGSGGPLTRVEISPDLNCAVDHTGDTVPEFFADTACATLLASGDTLYGPADIPAYSASPPTAFTPVSQSLVSGTGTAADPFTVVTVVSLGSSGLQITETDSYVTGEESYRTDVTVTNTSAVQATAVLYRAGDCFLQNSDQGFGSADAATGSVSCVAGVDDGNGNIVPGTRIEQWFPLSSGSHYLENSYSSVWAAIGTQQPFTDSCGQCANYVDNGAGLSWNLTIPANGSTTRSHLTVFSPLGIQPLSTTKTADSDSASPGGTDGYTITIHNPNVVGASLSSITDTLPAGFSYTAGSTTGATSVNPSISGQDLSWSGPISIPASGDRSIHFSVTVASTPGDYLNNAGGTAEGFTVAPTGGTANITVSGPTTHVPDAPVMNQVLPGKAQVSFNFSAGASDGGAAVSGFKVSVCPPTGPCGVISLGATTFSGIASGLTNGTQYCLTVVATNAVGDSPPSAAKCATPDASSDTQLISGTAPITLSNVPPGGQPAAGTIASTVNLFADPNNAGKPAGLTVKPVIPNSGFQCLAPGGVTSTCMTNKFVEATYPTGNMNRLHKETNAFSRTDSIDKDGIPCFAAQLDTTGKPVRCLLPPMPLCPPTGGGLRCAFIYYVTMQIPGFSLVDSSGQLRPRPVSCSSAGCDASAVIGSSLIGGIPMPGQPGKYIVRPWCLSSSGNCAFAPAISMVEFTFQFSHLPIITGVKFSEWVPGDPRTGVLR